MSRVNSENYWDDRFKDDWVENNGDEQGKFFMGVALEMFPQWLINELGQGNKTVCDWGCAEGDGTNILAKKFPETRFVGIDFADTAIEKARAKYKAKNLSFESTDLLTEKYAKKFEIMISSNVFEHFTDTWKTFDTVSAYAKDLFIMMVPFNEDPKNLIPEHFHSFNTGDFKLQSKRWEIIHFAVTNTAERTPTYWAGQQALVIFADKAYARKLNLTFADVNLAADLPLLANDSIQSATSVYVERIGLLEQEITRLSASLESRRYRAANKIVDTAHAVMRPDSIKRAAQRIKHRTLGRRNR